MRLSRNGWRSASFLLALALLPGPAKAADSKPVTLSIAEISQAKQKSCALFHVWATWCVPCIEELPKFLKFAAAHPKVTPIILDISAPYVQDNFSKKWMKQLKPPFPTYLKPDGEDKPYLEAIEKPWPNRLPYNALYDKGKRKGRWMGTQDYAALGPELTRLCQ